MSLGGGARGAGPVVHGEADVEALVEAGPESDADGVVPAEGGRLRIQEVRREVRAAGPVEEVDPRRFATVQRARVPGVRDLRREELAAELERLREAEEIDAVGAGIRRAVRRAREERRGARRRVEALVRLVGGVRLGLVVAADDRELGPNQLAQPRGIPGGGGGIVGDRRERSRHSHRASAEAEAVVEGRGPEREASDDPGSGLSRGPRSQCGDGDGDHQADGRNQARRHEVPPCKAIEQ